MANQGNQSGGSNQSSGSQREASGSGGATRQGGQGFAGMSDEEQRRAAQKGGEAVSEDREHMADIGRKGGEASAQNRGSQASSRSDRDVQDSGNKATDRGGSGSNSGSENDRGSSGRNS